MSHVSLTLNGRTYRLRCGEGQERRLEELAQHVQGHIDRLVQEFGQAGDDKLLVMAALLIADELWDERGLASRLGQAGEIPEFAEHSDSEPAS